MTHKYEQDYAVHPGETVKECMAMYRVTPHEMACEHFREPDESPDYYDSLDVEDEDEMLRRNEISRFTEEITEIAFGLREIELSQACAFSATFNLHEVFWLERQRIYDERIAGLPECNLSTKPDPE